MATKLIDLTGKRFGRLIVIKRSLSGKKQPLWLCKCDCGKERIIQGNHLRNGIITSCGCLKIEKQTLGLGIAALHKTISFYKRNAKNRGYEYKLSEKQFKEITQKPCYYCGAVPKNITKQAYLNGNYIYNGIDRIDNTKDYAIDNVVPCCKICNSAKRDLTTQEFNDWIIKVWERREIWTNYN